MCKTYMWPGRPYEMNPLSSVDCEETRLAALNLFHVLCGLWKSFPCISRTKRYENLLVSWWTTQQCWQHRQLFLKSLAGGYTGTLYPSFDGCMTSRHFPAIVYAEWFWPRYYKVDHSKEIVQTDVVLLSCGSGNRYNLRDRCWCSRLARCLATWWCSPGILPWLNQAAQVILQKLSISTFI